MAPGEEREEKQRTRGGRPCWIHWRMTGNTGKSRQVWSLGLQGRPRRRDPAPDLSPMSCAPSCRRMYEYVLSRMYEGVASRRGKRWMARMGRWAPLFDLPRTYWGRQPWQGPQGRAWSTRCGDTLFPRVHFAPDSLAIGDAEVGTRPVKMCTLPCLPSPPRVAEIASFSGPHDFQDIHCDTAACYLASLAVWACLGWAERGSAKGRV